MATTTKKHRILPRDIEAYALAGRFRMLTRQQLKGWLFSDVSETMVTRFFDRSTERGYLGVDRLHGNGIQVCWLTKKGRDFLVDGGHAATSDLFPASSPVPAKDFAHTVQIVNAALAMRRRTPSPAERMSCCLRGRCSGCSQGNSPSGRTCCACGSRKRTQAPRSPIEVDLGGEPVKTVLVPKTLELIHFLSA